MTSIDVIKIKLNAAKTHLVGSIEIRDQVQARADECTEESIRTILILTAMELNELIMEQDKEIKECEEMIAEYERRLAALHQL